MGDFKNSGCGDSVEAGFCGSDNALASVRPDRNSESSGKSPRRGVQELLSGATTG